MAIGVFFLAAYGKFGLAIDIAGTKTRRLPRNRGPHHCFRVMQSPEGNCENNPIVGFSTPLLDARQSPSVMVKYRRLPRM